MSEPFVGEIKMFGGNFAPRGYNMCSGQLLPLQQNSALFSILGTSFGGDGVSTFGLPHFGGRSPIGQGTPAPGVPTTYNLGEFGGFETAALLSTNMPVHTHLQQVIGETATTDIPGPGTYLAAAVDGSGNAVNIYGTDITKSPTTLAPQSLTIAGGSQPFAIRNPYQAVSFIIALVGIFPSRN